ncbi:MAG: DUF5018 domain-containing protein [Treponema sp.]|jgi:hypothetical protein|nr:DUF5018 domain-containing protein [Treponema sp.]
METRSLYAGATRALLILTAAAILAACASPLGNRTEGNLRIVLAGGAPAGARGIPPDLSYYQLEFSSPGGETLSRTFAPEPGTHTLTLNLGQWTIRAKAFTAEDVLRGSGETTVLVEAGKINDATIAMKTAFVNITAFSFAGLPPAVIDPNTKTVAVTVPFGTDVTGLVPTIAVSEGAAISPASGEARDFTGSVVYTVTAANGSTGKWTVMVTVTPNDAATSAGFSFVIEGPGDLMVPVTITHSAGSASSPAISWLGGESLTFTADAAYSVGAGNLKWLVNGKEADAAGNSLTINARDYVLRYCTLTAMIKEQGQWYSGNYDFTVAM